MGKLTDNEIIKALECCGKNTCRECIYNTSDDRFDLTCTTNMAKDALDLINRLQKENKKNENIIRLADKTIETQQAEIERLKAESERLCIELDETIIAKDLLFDEAEALIKIVKSEAYKEFADRLKEKSEIWEVDEYFNYVKQEHIDNLLKEMVGE